MVEFSLQLRICYHGDGKELDKSAKPVIDEAEGPPDEGEWRRDMGNKFRPLGFAGASSLPSAQLRMIKDIDRSSRTQVASGNMDTKIFRIEAAQSTLQPLPLRFGDFARQPKASVEKNSPDIFRKLIPVSIALES